MKPTFSAGRNLAMKVPRHEYERTVAFYRDVIRLPQIERPAESSTRLVRFAFGDLVLWIDCVPALSQAKIWMELMVDDVAAAKARLAGEGCAIRNEIEPLPDGFNGFWISNPANVIHLIAAAES